jgi:predicted transcriptional regulator
MPAQRITIIKIRRAPQTQGVNDELQWLGNSLGLFGERDKDSSCFRIFIELIKSARGQKGLTSDELAYRLNLTRGTVVHHINRLKESGIVVHESKRYLLRDNHLERLIDELENDAERTFKELKNIAKEIDKNLGL